MQAALRALSGLRFFAAVEQRALLGNLRQVRDYLLQPEVRQEAGRRVAGAVDQGRSGAGWAFAGLDSGLRSAVREPGLAGADAGHAGLAVRDREFDLRPTAADVVAMVKDLRPLFGSRVHGWLVDNGAHAHEVMPYLTAVETGRAVRTGTARSLPMT